MKLKPDLNPSLVSTKRPHVAEMDWISFLTDQGVPYVTRGPNTKRGEISIKCPYCGDDDPSEHLGISLTSENWGCHRSALHRGRAARRLVQVLLGCSYDQAKLVVASYSSPDPDRLGDIAQMLNPTSEPPKPATGPLGLPLGYRAISRTGSTAKYWAYLASRGFDDVDDLVARYQLGCCLTGQWKDRIIIPFYQGGELIGWTGRAIQATSIAPRYLSSSDAVKRTVLGRDELMEGGKVLFVVEGPFDALKLDYYGEPCHVRATCVFGVTMTTDQICILNSLKKRFKKVVLLFDTGAMAETFYAADWLHAPNVVIGSLPEGVKDPGELSPDNADKLIGEYL